MNNFEKKIILKCVYNLQNNNNFNKDDNKKILNFVEQNLNIKIKREKSKYNKLSAKEIRNIYSAQNFFLL